MTIAEKLARLALEMAEQSAENKQYDSVTRLAVAAHYLAKASADVNPNWEAPD